MLLALNIGNTNITFGSFASDGRLAFVSRLYADPALSSDEICYKIINMLDLYGASPLDIEGVILGSVVPSITGRMREALRKMTQAPVLEVGPGLRSGVRIRMDNPAQLGAELLCATVGALRRHTPPLLVIHMDTAATMLAVDAEGSLVGGVILPGPQVSLRALVENTAQLPQVELHTTPRKLLGSNTADCLHSGAVLGTAAMLDAMVGKIRAALDAPQAPVVATGTLPASIRDACETTIEYRETLVLEGLYALKFSTILWKTPHPGGVFGGKHAFPARGPAFGTAFSVCCSCCFHFGKFSGLFR